MSCPHLSKILLLLERCDNLFLRSKSQKKYQQYETYANTDFILCSLPQELEVRSLYHLYSLKTKSLRCHYVVMTRSETKLSVAIPAPVSGQSAVNIATATSKCSITFLLPYDQDGDVKTEQDNVSNIL